jgi:hypothetical protein
MPVLEREIEGKRYHKTVMNVNKSDSLEVSSTQIWAIVLFMNSAYKFAACY